MLRIALVCLVCLAVPAHAADRSLVIATKPSPPFAMKGDDGQWTGISIELWRQIATDLGVKFEIKEYDLAGMLAAVEHHEADVAVAAVTITAEREAKLDFTHPIYSTGLSIAVRPGGSGGTLAVMKSLLTWDLLKVLVLLFALLASIGALVWVFERHRNEQFAKAPMRGIAAGVWWSAVTMTTVGYGDKAPVTVPGRALGIVWMFSAIIITAIFTASVTSTLTVDRLESAIKGPEDLVHVRVATVANSTSAKYLDTHHVTYRAVPTVLDGERAVAANEVDAMVYDAPILKYVATHDLGGAVTVLPAVFDHQDYGFAIADASPLREEINRVLLTELAAPRWTELVEHYLGKD